MPSIRTYKLSKTFFLLCCVLYNLVCTVTATNHLANRAVKSEQSQQLVGERQKRQQQSFLRDGQALQPQRQVFSAQPQNSQVHQQQGIASNGNMPLSTLLQPNIQKTGNSHNEYFVKNLYQIVCARNSNTNIIYSPISLQTLLAFIYTGARGTTAHELQAALQIPANKTEVAYFFQHLLSSMQAQTGQTQLAMANKIYTSSDLRLLNRIPEFAYRFFGAEIEPTNFADSRNAAHLINTWVERQTANHIRHIISPNDILRNTQAILVNAIYFKGRWATEFSVSNTQTQAFTTSSQREVPVDMMYLEDIFRYNEFPSLGASILELPYIDHDTSMLVILPFENSTLYNVENQMGTVDILSLVQQLKPETVTVRLPKFRIEFDLDMMQALQKLNIRELFSTNADLGSFFQDGKSTTVSKVQHKAFIEVNEAGSEAAASTFTRFYPLSLPPREIYFLANRPFMFIIRSPDVTLFMGHVVSF